jgi:hypothetical protein
MLKGNSNKKVGFRGLVDTAEANFGEFRIEFLGEFEAICQTALACESGPLGGLIDEKNQGSKISWHCPFKKELVISHFAPKSTG